MTDLYINQDLLKNFSSVDALIFGVDGVLVDVSRSIPVAVSHAVQYYAQEVLGLTGEAVLLSPNETALFGPEQNLGGGAEMTLAAAALVIARWSQTEANTLEEIREQEPSWEDFATRLGRVGGGVQNAEHTILEFLTPTQRREFSLKWNPKLITQLFQEFYAGEDNCRELYGFSAAQVNHEGLYQQETALADPELFPAKMKLGLISNRSLLETRLTLRHTGLGRAIPESAWVTTDDYVKAPDGRTLAVAREKLKFQNAIFVSSDLDGLYSVQNYRELQGSGKARVQTAVTLTGSGGAVNPKPFLEAGAGIVTPNINALLQFMKGRSK